ncbi:MAG: amidohydrolase [Desulfobulbaceae bacterium]|uniref:Amidohydrolase n=1 Tax=Candidatus Desulfatifera sulfidica TaxID=2841691 RepID=A0A8J6N876_9BACT|nr:amidohydrolase [Candidatus Desulfatifera sulfidica]
MYDSLLITDCLLLQESQGPLLPSAYILCENGKISSIGPMTELRRPLNMKEINGCGQLALPGLINGHNHCAMTLFRGLADDLELGTWLNDHIFPAEAAHVNADMVYWCSKLAAAEMLLSGTTTVADAYFFEDAAIRAFADSGMRAVAAHGVIDFPAPGVPDPTKNIWTAAQFIDRHLGTNPLITPAVFAHSPYTCSNNTLQEAKKLANDQGVPFFIHAAETRHEQGLIATPLGDSPIRHLAALNLLDQNTILVHCVWLDDADLQLIAKSGAKIVACPQSNQKLASGSPRISEMLALGIQVGLGTDGCASNNSLDLFREMDILAKGQKVRTLSATALTARQALACTTSQGAAVLGQPNLGRLSPGSPADLIMINLKHPHLQPFYSQDTLVYSASGADITNVIINGRLVVHKRQIISFDLQECLRQVRTLAKLLSPSKAEL